MERIIHDLQTFLTVLQQVEHLLIVDLDVAHPQFRVSEGADRS